MGSPQRFDTAQDQLDTDLLDERVWKVANEFKEAHRTQILSLCFHENLLFSSSTKNIKIWNVDKYKKELAFQGQLPEQPGLVKCMVYWKENNLLLVAVDK